MDPPIWIRRTTARNEGVAWVLTVWVDAMLLLRECRSPTLLNQADQLGSGIQLVRPTSDYDLP